MQGKIKFFNEEKGFGFVTGDDGQDYFMHISQITEGVVLEKDDEVSFEPAKNEKGNQAKSVELLN